MEKPIEWYFEHTKPKGTGRMRAETELKDNFRRHCQQWNDGTQAEIFAESKVPIEAGLIVSDLNDTTYERAQGSLISKKEKGLWTRRSMAELFRETEALKKLLIQRDIGQAWILYYQALILEFTENKEPDSVMNRKTTEFSTEPSERDINRVKAILAEA